MRKKVLLLLSIIINYDHNFSHYDRKIVNNTICLIMFNITSNKNFYYRQHNYAHINFMLLLGRRAAAAVATIRHRQATRDNRQIDNIPASHFVQKHLKQNSKTDNFKKTKNGSWMEVE